MQLLTIDKKALYYLETEQNALYQDVKPENIVLTCIGGKAVAKLVDFGLAKEIGTIDSAQGSLQFAPEEKIRGDFNNPKSDVWSLGITTASVALKRDIFPNLTGKNFLKTITTFMTKEADYGLVTRSVILTHFKLHEDGQTQEAIKHMLVRDPKMRWTSLNVLSTLTGEKAMDVGGASTEIGTGAGSADKDLS